MRFLSFLLKVNSVALLMSFVVLACHPKVRLIKSPPHYNFSEAFTDKLDLRLKEISGLVWDTKNNEFIAQEDESGKLFFLDRETKAIKEEVSFADKGDYEDVAIYNDTIYILRSDGMITRFVKDGQGHAHGIEIGKVAITGTNDFETMYPDTARKALVLICKNCAMDNKTSVSAFAFYPDSTGFDNKPLYTIDAAEVARRSSDKTSKFQPSAAAIHPVLQKLFILSSASKTLVIADLNGKVEGVYELGKTLFPQPEGITFKSNGDMYISNEGVNAKGTISRFLYKP